MEEGVTEGSGLTGYSVSALEDEKVLEWAVAMVTQHCGCPQCHWIVHLKWLLCILYHNKKKERKRKRTTYQSMKWEGTLIPLRFLTSLVQWAELSEWLRKDQSQRKQCSSPVLAKHMHLHWQNYMVWILEIYMYN